MTQLTGVRRLVRLALRRDRVRLIIWVLALMLGTVGTASALAGLYVTEQNRQAVAATMDSAAGLAMSGPREYLVDYTYGAMMGHQMLGFTVVLVGIMSVLLVVRHSRTEEESGRAELVRSSVVGRHAHLASVLMVAAVANLLVGLLMAAGMVSLGLEGIDWSGSLLYGMAHAAGGMFFAAVAAVTVQITEHPRGAGGLGFAVIGVAYLLRALGDIGDGTLSWFSPIGWTQATLVFIEDNWWPLLLSVVVSVVLVGFGFGLSTRRDVGAGLRRPRPGTPSASRFLVRPVGFAMRLHRGLLIGFGIGLAVLGMSYGSVLGDAQEMLAGIEMLEEALAAMGGATIIESFASLILTVMAVITSIYVVMAAFRARSEESAGRAEPILATGISQERWVGSHVLVTMVGAVAVMGLAGLGFGLTGASVTGDNALIGDLFWASMAYVPALWVAAGVAVALFGLWPRAASLAWIVPIYGFVVGYLGQILQFPDWMMNLSPFGHVPRMPAEAMNWTPILVLTAVAVALLAAGIAGFRRRDLLSTA